MEGSIDFSEEVYALLDKLASTQYLPEKPAAEKLVAILKEKLHGEPEKLRSLSTAVNQLLLQICSCDGDVITIKQVPQVFLQRVESILEGDNELMSEFHSFLRDQNPKKSQAVIYQELAPGFMENYGEPVYNHLREIMGEYKLERKKNPHDLFKKVRVTFYNYPDIEEEFAKFLPDSEYINTAKKKSREVVQVGRQKRKARYEEIELERSGGKARKLEMKRVDVQVEDSREEKREVGKEKRFVEVQDRSVELMLKWKELLDRSVDWESINTAKKSRELGANFLKWNEQLLCFLGKVEQRFSSSSLRYYDFLVLLLNYPEKTERAEIENRISGILGKHSDLMSEFQMLEKNLEDKTMWWCTPSYRLQVSPKPLATDRTEVGMEVLNDCWVCAPPVNEEGSSNCGKDGEKEKMFKDEDERYEKDMMIGWIVSAIEFAEQKLVSPSKAVGPGRFRLKRCIEQLYGDEAASQVLSMIEMEPEKSLPVIKKRLEGKLQELKSL